MLRHKRHGVIVVMAAVLLVVMVALIAFAVDIGIISVARTELQSAADAAALAGVYDLPRGESNAVVTASDYVDRNLQVTDPPSITSSTGQWDFDARQFQAGVKPLDALRVTLQTTNQSLFFGRALGANSFNAAATATAVVRPRDFVLVLDFSGSMNSHKRIDQLKVAVDLFLDVLDDQGSQDRVAFVRYATKGETVISLTSNFNQVNKLVQETKATGWTNIYEGMKLAREEFTANGRRNATKMMVIMTDGKANKPDDHDPKTSVVTEAQAAHAEGVDLYTISFGDDADKSLMAQVAAVGGDVHFPVDGSVAEVGEELREVFVKIANRRKVILVQ